MNSKQRVSILLYAIVAAPLAAAVVSGVVWPEFGDGYLFYAHLLVIATYALFASLNWRAYFNWLAVCFPVLVISVVECCLFVGAGAVQTPVFLADRQAAHPENGLVSQKSIDVQYTRLFQTNSPYRDYYRSIVLGKYDSPAVKTNSRGYRAGEFEKKGEGVTRIVLLGDSAAFGWQAADDSRTVAARLETILGERFPDRRVQVLNLATPAGNSVIDYQILTNDMVDLHPDIVVFLAGNNDLNGSIVNLDNYAGILKEYCGLSPTSIMQNLGKATHFGLLTLNSVFSKLRLYKYILQRVNTTYGWFYDFDPENNKFQKSDFPRYRDTYAATLEKIARFAQTNAMKLILFHQPTWYVTRMNRLDSQGRAEAEAANPLYYRNNYETLPQLVAGLDADMRRFGASYVDLTHVFDDVRGELVQGDAVDLSLGPQAPVYITNTHWTARGTDMVAQAMLPHILPLITGP